MVTMAFFPARWAAATICLIRSEEHTSELQSRLHLVCRLLLEKKQQHESHPADLRDRLRSPRITAALNDLALRLRLLLAFQSLAGPARHRTLPPAPRAVRPAEH